MRSEGQGQGWSNEGKRGTRGRGQRQGGSLMDVKWEQQGGLRSEGKRKCNNFHVTGKDWSNFQ